MSTRRIILILAFLGFSAAASAQDITGLWMGTLHNDTTGKNQRYEVAISENKGKLFGYSHTFFIVDDREYSGIKKLKIKRVDDKIIIQDMDVVINNYPEASAKVVKKLNVLTLEIRDSLMIMTGNFSTNQTKEYSVLTGSTYLQRKNDYWRSALVPHLEELGLAKDLSFIVPETTAPDIAAINKPIITEQPVAATTTKKNKAPISVKETKIVQAQLDTTSSKPVAVAKPVIAEKPVKASGPAADVGIRKIETIQSVYFKSDSLVLTLYDNGVVDGDTVSVLMNGKILMPNVGLSTKAVRKTITLTPDMPDSIQLILYAENLGSIPPNTGLLVVHDGEDIYEIRFSGDMNKSSAIVFRRKR